MNNASSKERMTSLAEHFDRQHRERQQKREMEGIGPVLAEMHVQREDLPSEKALGAMLRASFAAETEPGGARVTVRLAPVGQSLERDGCDYLHVALKFLQFFHCPPECQMFVLAICALSGGDAESFHVVPDVKIAEIIGYNRHQIKPIRERLIEWQRETNYAFIDIIEGDYDRTKKKHVATQYRTRIVGKLAELLRDARGMGLRSEQAAIRIAAEKKLHQLFEDKTSDIPTGSLVQRRETQRGYTKGQFATAQAERQINMTYARLNRCEQEVNDLMGTFLMNGTNPWAMRDELVRRIDDNLRRITQHYPEYQRE